MQGKSKDIPVQFPIGGLDQGMGKRSQQPQTTTDCKNVMAFDAEENRMRGGRRPGLKLKTIVPVNGKIQLIDTIVPASASGDTDSAGAYASYYGGQFAGFNANVNEWFGLSGLPANSTVSDVAGFPTFREVSDLAPKTNNPGNWEMGRYGTQMGNKDIPLLPTGNKIRTAGNGCWVMREWNDKKVLCPSPPLPYDDPFTSRGRPKENDYYRNYGEGMLTNTGAAPKSPRHETYLPNSNRTSTERASADRLFFGGGNNKSVGDVEALPTDKMSFSTVLFPFIDKDESSDNAPNDPFYSGIGKDWVASCSIRPVPWDNVKNRNIGGSFNYGLANLVRLKQGTGTGAAAGDFFRIWDTNAGDWVSEDTAQYLTESFGFSDEKNNANSKAGYYYGMVFRIRADYHRTSEVGTEEGDIKIDNSLNDNSPGLFVGFVADYEYYTNVDYAGGGNGDQDKVEFVVAQIVNADPGTSDPFKDALHDIIRFDGTQGDTGDPSSTVTIKPWDPHGNLSEMEWFDLEVKCAGDMLSITLSGEELKFPTTIANGVRADDQYRLNLKEYLLNYVDPTEDYTDLSVLEGSRVSSGLVFGVHKHLQLELQWFLIRNASYTGGIGNEFILRDGVNTSPGNGNPTIGPDMPMHLGADSNINNNYYRLYVKTAAQDFETEDNFRRVDSYSCDREHALAEGGDLNGKKIKGYFSGWRHSTDSDAWDSGVTPALNTNYGGSARDDGFENEAPIRGGGANGADDGTGFHWIQCHFVKQLMFLNHYGADWLRTWMEPGFADFSWKAIDRSDTARKPSTIVVTEGRVRDSKNNEFFGNPTDNYKFVLDKNRAVVTGTPFLDKYYFADGLHYFRFDPAARSVEDWYAKALVEYQNSDFGDSDTTSISMPGGANFATYDDPESEPVLNPKPKLISQYMGRLVLSGKADEPNNWWMSGTGNWWHWNTGDNVIGDGVIDASGPVAGNSTNLAEIGDPIRAIFPLHTSSFALATRDSIYALTDDPFADSAQLVPISLTVGVASPEAYCYAANKTLFFFSEDGLYRLQPNDYNVDRSERVSLGRLDREFTGIDFNKYTVKLVYDHVYFGVHIFLIPSEQDIAGQSTKHYFYDDRNDSFWPMDYPAVAGPSYAYYYTSPNAKDKAVLYGGFDGGIRMLDRGQDSDDGVAIDSYVWIGPIFGDQVNETKLMRIAAVLDENSSILNYEIYVGDTVDNAKNSKAVLTSSWNSGRNPWQYARCRGSNIFIKVYQNGKLTPWSFEQITATVALAGQSRVRD